MSTATEMELRVAKAICAQGAAAGVFFDMQGSDGLVWDFTRAAIQAMREPTKEMIALGNDQIEYDLDAGYPSSGPTVEILSTSARDAWRAMIDAASPPIEEK